MLTSFLNADGPPSFDRSGYWTTIFKFILCLQCGAPHTDNQATITENKHYDISCSLTADGIFRHTDDNARQALQADVMVSLLKADGPLSWDIRILDNIFLSSYIITRVAWLYYVMRPAK